MSRSGLCDKCGAGTFRGSLYCPRCLEQLKKLREEKEREQ